MHVSQSVYVGMVVGVTHFSPARRPISVLSLSSHRSRRNADIVGCVIVVQSATLMGLHG
jgi:hypothetical protein